MEFESFFQLFDREMEQNQVPILTIWLVIMEWNETYVYFKTILYHRRLYFLKLIFVLIKKIKLDTSLPSKL